MSRPFRILPFYGSREGLIRSPLKAASAASIIHDLLHPVDSRRAQLAAIDISERSDAGSTDLRPRVLGDDHAASRVELYYNSHHAATYTLDDLPPIVGAKVDELFDRRVERDIAPYVGKRQTSGTGKHQRAVREILNEYCYQNTNSSDADTLYEKIAPHLK